MRKFMLVAAAVAGVSFLGMNGVAEAGPHDHGHNHGNHRDYNRGYDRGHRHNHWHGNRGPVYRPPVYRPPVRTYPVAPVYRPYPIYNRGPAFGISTPNFGLFIN